MTRDEPRPWSTLLGLLAACLATITGAIARVDPDVVLLRALQAGLAVALTCVIARLVFVMILGVSSRK